MRSNCEMIFVKVFALFTIWVTIVTAQEGQEPPPMTEKPPPMTEKPAQKPPEPRRTTEKTLVTYPFTIVVSSLKYKQFKPSEVPEDLQVFTGTVPQKGTMPGWFFVKDWTETPQVEWLTYPNKKRGRNGSPWYRRTIRRKLTELRSYFRHYQTQFVSHLFICLLVNSWINCFFSFCSQEVYDNKIKEQKEAEVRNFTLHFSLFINFLL